MGAASPSIRNVLTSHQSSDGKQRHGFFSKELAGPRKEWAKMSFMNLGLITITMFATLSIYFGSYYEQVPRATHFSIEVIDLDSAASPYGVAAHAAVLGPAVRQAIATAVQTEPTLGWYEADSETVQQFALTPGGQGLDAFEYASQKVLNQDIWGALIINANATSGVWAGLTGGALWDPAGAMTLVYEEARNFYGTDQYVSRLGLSLMTVAGSSAGTTLAAQVLALGNATAVLSSTGGKNVIGAFAYSEYNLRPFDELGGIPATTVGTIYLIIFTFLISSTVNNVALPLIQDKLALTSEVAVKVLLPWLAYFWLSLNFSLVSVAFLVTFNRYYGYGGFVIYWMLNWVTMTALGFVMETVFLLLGPFFTFFLIFWVIINVSVAFLSISDMATFYRYGYIMPVWNSVDGAKSIIFGTKNHLVQNFAVNLGWAAVGACVLSTVVITQRRKKEAGRMKSKWEEMKKRDQGRGAGDEPDGGENGENEENGEDEE